jgi:hypothetical protein
METTKAAFEKLVFFGYKPILLAPKSKKPIFAEWNKHYNCHKYFPLLNNTDGFNVGILLGNVIDIEGDDEKANKFLNDLFINIPHPSFKSYKSTHHLFRARPNYNLTRFQGRGIEIRARDHQSVVPPSIHELEGAVYEWTSDVQHISTLPILTKQIEYAIYRYCNLNNKTVKKGSCVIHCNECRKKCYLKKKRVELEIYFYKSKNQKWICHECRNQPVAKELRAFKRSGCMDDLFRIQLG